MDGIGQVFSLIVDFVDTRYILPVYLSVNYYLVENA
jgi:hypothetical protein